VGVVAGWVVDVRQRSLEVGVASGGRTRARGWGMYQREALGKTNGDSEQHAGRSSENSKYNSGGFLVFTVSFYT
jgi:hypothetical protein